MAHLLSGFIYLLMLTMTLLVDHRECDSPLRLTNFTLDYLGDNWSDDIDFVICKLLVCLLDFRSLRFLKGPETMQGECGVYSAVVRFWCSGSRHDEDHKIPRTTAEIYDLNRAVAKKMVNVFLKKGIPVIPSIGERHTTIQPPSHNTKIYRE